MTEFVDPFRLPATAYKRSINPVGDYIEQASLYLSIETGKPQEECKAFITSGLNNRLFPDVNNPKVTYLQRNDNGDREIQEITLMGYLKEVTGKEELLAPTMTTYLPPKQHESVLVRYIDSNVKKRSVAKKAMFAAAAAGDIEKEFFENVTQRNTKLGNNAISGAHASNSNVLYNQTAHSTLTSNCRLTSGYGNANNEKLLTGNRHYWNPYIVLNNIISIIQNTDYEKLQVIINKYNLVLPDVDQALVCVKYSTDFYWYSPAGLQWIERLLFKLTPLQRAAFVYTGDLYHIKKHNEEFIRTFITKLTRKVTGKVDNPIATIHDFHEDHLNFAHQICSEEMKGKGKDYKAIKDSEELQTLYLTTKNIQDTITEYFDFIQCIMVNNNVPASVGHFPDSIRRAAITSDTDSTIFTAQDWVQWYFGEIRFDPPAIAVGSAMIFLASQAIVHILAKMSKNFGIEDKRLFQVAMKNEFYFPIFIPTNVTKHYFALISAQEGNVFSKFKTEIKGVHLKSSNAPKHITKAAEEFMVSIMTRVANGEKISLAELLKHVADIERNIYNGIRNADRTYFRLGEIKNPSSYVKEKEQSPYIYHMFWQDNFAKKYGSVTEPPYQVLRVSTKLENPTEVQKWLNEMEDTSLSQSIKDWMVKYKKTALPSLLVPLDIVEASGFPKEIVEIIDSRNIVADLSKVFYLILETTGFYTMNKHRTTLISDYY